MHPDIDEMIDLMDRAFTDFESPMPTKPKLIKLSFGTAFRYEEKDIYQAIMQKLARVQSLVRSARLLLINGFLQEQAILHRTIDETNEDIMFLIYAISNDTETDLHKRYLVAFWEEEIDESGNMKDSKQKRQMVPRQKIRAYLANIEGVKMDPNTANELTRTVSKAYSGFVHGASPQIMDMYGGQPPKFHTSGMLGTARMNEHADDLWNYAYRSFISHIVVGKALGAGEYVDTLTAHLRRFEANACIERNQT